MEELCKRRARYLASPTRNPLVWSLEVSGGERQAIFVADENLFQGRQGCVVSGMRRREQRPGEDFRVAEACSMLLRE